MEGPDSVGWVLARLLLFIRSRRTYALHLILLLQTLISSFAGFITLGLSDWRSHAPPIPSQDLLGVFLCRAFYSFSGLFLTNDAGHLVLAHAVLVAIFPICQLSLQ